MSNYIADFRNGAVNPYNFVSLGSGVERSAPSSGSISGVIHCSMKNATPLALPDLPNVETELVKNEKGKLDEHKKAPFFKIDGKPVITGSEIRGVIRSAYETLSNSCLSVNNNNILSARSSDVRTAGLIRFENEDKKWHLYKADTRKLEDFDETANTFKRTWKNKEYKNGKPVSNKKVPISYKFSTSFEEVEVDDLELAVEDYNTVCKIYLDNAKKDDPHTDLGYYIHTPLKDGKCYPIYYLEFSDESGRKYVWLSPAQISRSVFRKKVDDMLGSYRHCDNTNDVCEACGLFGMIGKKGCSPSAIASRLRFTDAKIESEPKLTYETLRELASPHLSSIEFYSTAPNTKIRWNYDDKGVKLNGRKYYFHHSGKYSTDEKTGRNITTEVLGKGAKFGFDIFFDKLTEDELKRLVWTLAIGENKPDGKQMHKIGHGKPLGLGSVKITVNSVTKRSFDPITMTFGDENMNVDAFFENTPFEKNAEYFKEFMAITDFDYLGGKRVDYPYGEEINSKNNNTSNGTMIWFKGNRNDGRVSNSKKNDQVNDKPDTIRYCLPKITDKKGLVLPALIKNNDSFNKNSNFGYNDGWHNSNKKLKTNYEPDEIKPITKKIKCPKCKKTMVRPANKIPMRNMTSCDYCNTSFKAEY